jgi:orotate phosphoribosyltransferase
MVVVGDLVTSGRTVRLSVEAIRTAGVAAFGFRGC